MALPRVNADARPVILEHFAQQLEPGVHAVFVLIRPAGTTCGRWLHVQETITLLPLPPVSPALSPVERVRLYLRERYRLHRMLDDYEAVLEAVCRAWGRLFDETDRLTGLTVHPYLTVSGIP